MESTTREQSRSRELSEEQTSKLREEMKQLRLERDALETQFAEAEAVSNEGNVM